jgi:hypothetical protein
MPAWLAMFGRGRDRPAVPPLQWWMVAAAAVVAGVAWGATAGLLHEANQANDVNARAAARVDAIKTGLSVAAGAGGVFALLLAVRHQWQQELIVTDNTRDAEARRITELYGKAVEQLGSNKAPRPARRTLCAGPACPGQPHPTADHRQGHLCLPAHAIHAAPRPTRRRCLAALTPTVRNTHRGMQVRLTAQRILTRRLHPGDDPQNPVDGFWPNTDLN